jgi:hypothetical protein
MFQVHAIRVAAVAALGVLLLLGGAVGAEQEGQTAAAAALEVRVLQAQVSPGQGERYEVLYQMEVISVLRATSRVEPGETITVRAYALSAGAQARGLSEPNAPALLSPGWMGIAYLHPDPQASGPEARLQFTIAGNGESFADIPPGPPSLRWTE